jgi:hypothetical protein
MMGDIGIMKKGNGKNMKNQTIKLDPVKDDYSQDWWWVAHEHGIDSYSDDEMVKLVKNRYQLEIIGGVCDDEASYSYDDWALVKLGRSYYLVSTSGCSCPSPSETWRIEKGPATLAAIRKHVVDGDYKGYTMPKRQLDDFVALLDKAAKLK